MKHEHNFLLPRASEFGVIVPVRCGCCEGTGTAEMPRGSGRFDDCKPCEGSGEIEMFEGEIVEAGHA